MKEIVSNHKQCYLLLLIKNSFFSFAADLEEMCNEKISAYWRITWRFISPVIMFILFASSVVKAFYELPKYVAYDRETVSEHVYILLIAVCVQILIVFIFLTFR